jgi:hypothetical protein
MSQPCTHHFLGSLFVSRHRALPLTFANPDWDWGAVGEKPVFKVAEAQFSQLHRKSLLRNFPSPALRSFGEASFQQQADLATKLVNERRSFLYV